MIDCWSKATDGNGATVRVVLFDFKKTFDLIDHNLLMSKLRQLELDSRVINWLKDFLTDIK
jgi:retron-type reverse transcriptase